MRARALAAAPLPFPGNSVRATWKENADARPLKERERGREREREKEKEKEKEEQRGTITTPTRNSLRESLLEGAHILMDAAQEPNERRVADAVAKPAWWS